MKDVHMAPVEEVNTNDKPQMALKSALPSLSLETFKDSVLEEEDENFSLQLSDDEEDNNEEMSQNSVQQKDEKTETEETILNKFETSEQTTDQEVPMEIDEELQYSEGPIIETTKPPEEVADESNKSNPEQPSAEGSSKVNFLSGNVDSEDLLKVTTVKEVQDDNVEDKDDSSNDSSEKEDISEKDEAEDDGEITIETTVEDDVEIQEENLGEIEDTEKTNEEEAAKNDVDAQSSDDREGPKDATEVQSDNSDISSNVEAKETESSKEPQESEEDVVEVVETVPNVETTVKPPKRLLKEQDDPKSEIKKLKLDPEPPVPTRRIFTAFADFMKSKKIEKLSRAHLEEFCLQKMLEAIVNRSELGELRHQLQRQEEMIDVWRREVAAQAKQVKDLETVNKKLMTELKNRSDEQKALVPVKITRSVGLQVKLEAPPQVAKRRSSRGSTDGNTAPQASPLRTVKGSPVVVQQPQAKVPIKVASTPILNQALQKESTASGATSEGVIDLTDEDDKTTTTSTVTRNRARTSAPLTQSVQLVTNQGKTALPGMLPNNGQKVIYVVQSTGQQVNQNVLTTTSDLTKVGMPKTLMFKLSNNVLTNQTNGLISPLPNGSPQVSVLPQQPVQTFRSTSVRSHTTAAAAAPVPSTGVRTQRSTKSHPAPLPLSNAAAVHVAGRKPVPPEPHLSIKKSGQGIVLSWKMPYNLDNFETIASYQLYAYQETSSPPSSDMWRKVGDVKALALPMACTLTQFADGNKYYFAVRAVDVHKRFGAFSEPEPIML